MSRGRPALYTGASGKVSFDKAGSLGSKFVVQPKIDGSYCTIATDSSGRVSAVVSRRGELLRGVADSLRDIVWLPDSLLCGECELWTEAARRRVERSGFARVHLFDALRISGRDCASLSYSERRDFLLRAESFLVNENLDKPWLEEAYGARDPESGRWCRRIPKSWRRMPVVPQLPAHRWEEAWSDWVEADELVEGLVFVRLDAPVGKRGTKKKLKPVSTLDAYCLDFDEKRMTMQWGELVFTVGRRKRVEPRVGGLYEIAYESFYDNGTPRFPRLVRARPDLSGSLFVENSARYLS